MRAPPYSTALAATDRVTLRGKPYPANHPVLPGAADATVAPVLQGALDVILWVVTSG